MAKLYGDFDKPGPYLVLMRWNPGWFSAPHSYATDRIQMVLSGTWWVNSGADFSPADTVRVPAGGFVKRAARTFHYDGVPRIEKEPVVVAVFGIGPIDIELADPKQPSWRRWDDTQNCGARNCDAATSRAHLGDTLAELDGGGHLRSLDGACGAHSTEKRAVPSSTPTLAVLDTGATPQGCPSCATARSRRCGQGSGRCSFRPRVAKEPRLHGLLAKFARMRTCRRPLLQVRRLMCA